LPDTLIFSLILEKPLNRFVIAKTMNITSAFSSLARLSVPALATMAICAGFGAVAAPTAYAQSATTATVPVYGSVDLQRVARESKLNEQNRAEMGRLQTSLRNVIGQFQQHSAQFLTADEIKEMSDLILKEMPTEAEKKRRQALQDKATAFNSERVKLENTASPTDDNRKRYQELVTLDERGKQAIQALAADFQRRSDDKGIELENRLLTAIRGAVAKVAQEKKLTLVFDGAVAIYSANDITADVVKQINK
jgi:Skp family chaperone for outer membrane proteins